MNEEFKLDDLVEVPKWRHPVGKNWVIIGFASDGAEACIRRCTDKDVQTFVPLSELKHQENIHFPALQTPEDQDWEAQRQDSAPKEDVGGPLILKFGEGKILVCPVNYSDGSVGIAFSTKLGTGKVNEEHPTMRKGDVVPVADYDVILKFANRESLKVLQWAVEEALKENE